MITPSSSTTLSGNEQTENDITSSASIAPFAATITPYAITNVTTSVSGGSYSNGTTLNVLNGGLIASATFNSGATGIIYSGGIVSDTSFTSGALLTISSGGIAYKVTLNGTATVYSGGLYNANYNGIYGTVNLVGGTLSTGAVTSGGIVNVSSGGLTSDTTYNAGATLNVSSGGTTSRVGIFGSANILSGGAVSGGYVGSGGTVNNYTIRTG